jgi:hypothetical protein
MKAGKLSDSMTVEYDEKRYIDIPVSLQKLTETDRQQSASDHSQGLYRIDVICYVALSDIGNDQPQKECKIKIGNSTWLDEYIIASSTVEMGMAVLNLEAICE